MRLNKMRRIAMILYTSGIEYDDRIRKEILTVKHLFPDIEFEIFAILHGNSSKHGDFVSDYGIKYHIPFLKSRNKYKSGTHIIKKAWDFYSTIKTKLNDFDAIWCADIDPIFFILLSNIPKVWDLHELPQTLLGSRITKFLLKILMNRSKAVIHANPQRIDYLSRNGALANKESQFVIRNYPNFNEAQQFIDSTFLDFENWLNGSDCVYLQGINDKKRCDEESIEAVMAITGLKGVVVGKFNSELYEKLSLRYGEKLDESIYFTGMVPQKMTPHYIRRCVLSLVLYRNTSPNNFYCEPNRMFQSIMNNCPVVVGCNPPMKEFVEKYEVGVSIPSDGSNLGDIIDGLKEVLYNHSYYCNNILKSKDNILWTQQEGEFVKIIEKLF